MNMMLAAISGGGFIQLIVTIAVLALVYFVVDWGIKSIGVPEPFNKLIRAILIIAVVLFLVNALLALTGNAFIRW